MEMERYSSESMVSVLSANQGFVNRILLRNSSVGKPFHSYYQEPGNVPFQWEVKPGKPKDTPPLADKIIPLSLRPPPAAPSQGLSRLPRDSSRSRRWFWKKFKKNKKAKNVQAESRPESDLVVDSDGSSKSENFVLSTSDEDLFVSGSGSTSSSASNR